MRNEHGIDGGCCSSIDHCRDVWCICDYQRNGIEKRQKRRLLYIKMTIEYTISRVSELSWMRPFHRRSRVSYAGSRNILFMCSKMCLSHFCFYCFSFYFLFIFFFVGTQRCTRNVKGLIIILKSLNHKSWLTWIFFSLAVFCFFSCILILIWIKQPPQKRKKWRDVRGFIEKKKTFYTTQTDQV